jgi:DNA-directed RNA polymerase subunit RPC12/RpoP
MKGYVKMSANRKDSPWAFDESELKCPHCQSTRISRILDVWALRRGIQMYRCNACGKKFYDKGFDNYEPTY